MIHHLSPRPLLMFVAQTDFEVPVECGMGAFEKAREPKKMVVLPRVGHFEIFDGPAFEKQMKATVEFLQEWLL